MTFVDHVFSPRDCCRIATECFSVAADIPSRVRMCRPRELAPGILIILSESECHIRIVNPINLFF